MVVHWGRLDMEGLQLWDRVGLQALIWVFNGPETLLGPGQEQQDPALGPLALRAQPLVCMEELLGDLSCQKLDQSWIST